MLSEELKDHGVRVQVVCPGVVATEFRERQGLDLSALPRVGRRRRRRQPSRTGVRRVVCTPGVERSDLLAATFAAELAAFGAQSPQFARRYR